MSCSVFGAPNPLAPGPALPPSLSAAAAVDVDAMTRGALPPVRPAFNWRNTSDRLREGLQNPLPLDEHRVRSRRTNSAFIEIGIQRDLKKSRRASVLPFRTRDPKTTPATSPQTKRMSWALGRAEKDVPVVTQAGDASDRLAKMSAEQTQSSLSSDATTLQDTKTTPSRRLSWYNKLSGSSRRLRNKS